MPAQNVSYPEKIHTTVLPEEAIHYLGPRDGGIYMDGTLGLGGHSEKILVASSPTGRVIAFDWDQRAMELAQKRLAVFGDRVTMVRRNFAEIDLGLKEAKVSKIDGLILDLGLSSLQLDGASESDPGRGFSFKGSETLDMRMDNRMTMGAADLVNSAKEEELADILFHYGEEKQSRRIAAHIVKARAKGPIATTDALAEIVYHAIPRRFHPKNIHVATRTFQALRIAVNRELENIDTILRKAPSLLNPGARICIISFHSLEDRMVKWGFRNNPAWEIITKKPVSPTPGEIEANPRARSARMRVAELRDTARVATRPETR